MNTLYSTEYTLLNTILTDNKVKLITYGDKMYSTNIEILKYDNYRTFLKDVVHEQRELNQFSYRKFAKYSGFSSPNFLLLLIQGERNLSQLSAQKLGQAIGLKNIRLSFFSDLVEFNQSNQPSERYEKLQNLLKYRAKLNVQFIEDDVSDYLAHWVHSAIRELLIINPRLTLDEISSRLSPSITKAETQKSLSRLKSLHLISEENDHFKVLQNNLSTHHEFVTASAYAYHRQMIQLALESLDRYERHQRNITATTVSLSWENFQKIQNKIQDLRSEIMAISEIDQNKEEVFQFNFQLFPLSLKRD